MKQLLEQYWQCKTTPEEEKLLQEFFSGETIPKELEIYKSLFVWKNKQKNIRLNKDRIFLPQKTWIDSLYPTLKVAASVMILVTFAVGFYTHYQQERFMNKLFSETYTDPKEAVKETGKVVAKVSTLLQLVPEKFISETFIDSTETEETELTNDSIE
jgi:hypothetical protein